MKLKLLSYNVRGLNDPASIDNLRNYLHRNPVDFLFIQEHKLRGQGALHLGRTLWKCATTFITEAEPGYTIDGTHSGKGGMATLIAPRWSKLITDSGSLFGDRTHWCILSKLPGRDLGFVNLYAPNKPHTCRILWETLARELPTSCGWVMLGDFNMVERRGDKSNICGKMLPAQERLLFNSLKDTILVSEPPLTSSSLIYSWDNSRANGARVLARLDRYYIFPDSPPNSRKVLEYRIRGDHTRSDHCPVFFTLELSNPTPCPSRWIMSSAHFNETTPEIRAIWTAALIQAPFFQKLKRVIRFYIQRAQAF